MQSRASEQRKSKGCPTPIVYLLLQLTAVVLVLYIAKAFYIPTTALVVIFSIFTLFALNRTSKVCSRQRIRALNT